jgi:cell division septation protein DedD
MADNLQDKDKRFYFSRKQLLVLGAGFALTALIIYVLGILTGITIEANRSVTSDNALAKLADSHPADNVGAKEAATSDKPLTKLPGVEPGGHRPVKETKAQEQSVKPDLTEAPAAVKTTAPAPPAKEAQVSKNTEAKEADKLWAIQVRAFPNEKPADALVRDLKSKGYDAVIVKADVKGRPWYRVRIGHFATRGEAEALRKILESKEGLGDSFAVQQ